MSEQRKTWGRIIYAWGIVIMVHGVLTPGDQNWQNALAGSLIAIGAIMQGDV
jgi:hypothetical protein